MKGQSTDLRASADTSVEAAERNTLCLLDDILEESDGSPQRHALDGVGGFPRVLSKLTDFSTSAVNRKQPQRTLK